MKQQWVQEVVKLIMQVTPGLIKEFLASHVDDEQFARINALEARCDQLQAEIDKLRSGKGGGK